MNENAVETTGKNDLNKNLIKRFNFHSTMILKSALGTDTGTDAAAPSRVEAANEEDDDNVAKKVGAFIWTARISHAKSSWFPSVQT